MNKIQIVAIVGLIGLASLFIYTKRSSPNSIILMDVQNNNRPANPQTFGIGPLNDSPQPLSNVCSADKNCEKSLYPIQPIYVNYE